MPPITNSLETERRLEEMGFPPPQARGLAVLFEETASAIQQDLKAFIVSQFESLRADMKVMEERLRAEIHGVEARVQREMRMQLFWFTTIQGILIASFLGLLKIFGQG
jgi:hypothetical protein